MIKEILIVALGGGVGSALRYLTSTWGAKYGLYGFPLGTFSVNIVGCLIAGIVIGLSSKYPLFNGELRLLLMVGFCGGYTTFSAFSAESVKLFEAGSYLILFLYIIASVVLGMVALWCGNLLSKIVL